MVQEIKHLADTKLSRNSNAPKFLITSTVSCPRTHPKCCPVEWKAQPALPARTKILLYQNDPMIPHNDECRTLIVWRSEAIEGAAVVDE